ncbi:MAG: N-6 DNA methylase [Promethearchaeota archaeon]
MKKTKGQFFTPGFLVKAILDKVTTFFPKEYESRQITILDPAIGKGVFLSTLIPIISSKFHSVKLYGLDIDSSIIKIANKNLLPLAKEFNYEMEVKLGDFFLEFPLDFPKEFDVIIGNPPHNAKYSHSEWEEIRENCFFGQISNVRSESSVFFTLKSLNLLKPCGLLCFLLPKPIIYSKRWVVFREILLTDYTLIGVFDLGNQFTGQLQEQCALIIQKRTPISIGHQYVTGIWNSNLKKFLKVDRIFNKDAIALDNLLVGVSSAEMELIRRFHRKNYIDLDVNAFRGLSSRYRSIEGEIPLIEKSNFASGFLFPTQHYISPNTPQKLLLRQKVPKIIAQRIISYRTKPKFRLDVKTWFDSKGAILTHETVINIIPNYSQQIISYCAIAGLLESSFVEWWLKSTVYTQEFVTSKDFDKAYINSIRIPKIVGPINKNYRLKLSNLLQKKQYEEILNEVKNQSNIDKFFTLGEIYECYQTTGHKLKKKLLESIQAEKPFNEKFSEFRKCKLYYNRLLKRFYSPSEESHLQDQCEEILDLFSELKILKENMNEIVISLYEINSEERELIKKDLI